MAQPEVVAAFAVTPAQSTKSSGPCASTLLR